MWIRSESEHALVKCEQLAIVACDGYYGIYSNGIELGMYLTYEKALKVLDMIEEALSSNMKIELGGGLKYLVANYSIKYTAIFDMPKDCEVQEDE